MSPRVRLVQKRLFDRDFQKLTVLSAASLAVFGLILILVIAYAGWSSNTAAGERERTQLRNALNRGITKALSEQKSVAWWDEAVTKISDTAVDLEFTDSNFGLFLTEIYGHDEVYILGSRNQPIYSFVGTERLESAAFEKRRAELGAVVAEVRGQTVETLKVRADILGDEQKVYRAMGVASEVARRSGHFLNVDGRLAIVVAMTIVPNIDMSVLKGDPCLLVSVSYLDTDYVASVGRSLLLGNLSFTQEANPAFSSDMGMEPVESDDGHKMGVFIWTAQKPGDILLNAILPLVTFGVMAVAVLANGMLARLRNTSSNLAQREWEARHAASHDALSGLPNRANFTHCLSEAFLELAKHGGGHILVAYIDLDCFKDVNDTLGHHAGDELICAVAARFKEHMRADDELYRYGGDEFAILWKSTSPVATESLAWRIEKAFNRPFEVAGQSLTVTASVGIATAPGHGETALDLMRHADIALYQAKTLGRNRVTVFDREMARKVEERRAIELDLRVAIERSELRLAYQPLIACHDGSVSGVEALLRWRHPTRGDVSPGQFIPIAEQAGLMPVLGEWVISQAMKDARLWPDLEVSVNLSPVQFRQADLVARLNRLVETHGADPSKFVLEITEGVLMDQSDRTTVMLDDIREIGFKTALDDFGTGYSSLAYLCNFKFNKIKIDRSFVMGMSKSDRVRNIIEAVIAIGSGLGMTVVAEGVETQSDADAMTKMGCSELQGFLFSRPLDIDAMLAFIDKNGETRPRTGKVHTLDIHARARIS